MDGYYTVNHLRVTKMPRQVGWNLAPFASPLWKLAVAEMGIRTHPAHQKPYVAVLTTLTVFRLAILFCGQKYSSPAAQMTDKMNVCLITQDSWKWG